MSSYCYFEEEENIKEESINNYSNLFESYYKNPPSLKKALSEMYSLSQISKNQVNDLVNEIILNCENKIKDRMDEINNKYKNITKEDAIIICSYTYECDDKNYSPYKFLNKNLVSNNRQNGLKVISKYLFIFLKTLRKLPRYYPDKDNGNLYRCISVHINYKIDPLNKKSNPYLVGHKKTFWSFASASPNIYTSSDFLGKKSKLKSGTIFTLCGDVWGYDITVFNYFHEEEILLEPERKFVVEEIIPPFNEILYVRCKLENSCLVLSNELKVDDNNEINKNNINDKIENDNISNNKERTPSCKEEIKCVEGKNHQINKITGICINCQIMGCEYGLSKHNFNKISGKCIFCFIMGCENGLYEHNFNKYSGRCNYCQILGCEKGLLKHNFNIKNGRCDYCQLLGCEKGLSDHNFNKNSGKCIYCQIIGCKEGLREHNFNKYLGKCNFCGYKTNNNS